MRNLFSQFAAHPAGVIVLFAMAAFLEAYGDSFFQTGVHRSSGLARVFPLVFGTAVLALYGLIVNLPDWDFGKLIGLYAVVFFLAAQLVARFKFHQSPSPAIYAGGSLIAAGGAIIALWRP